MHHMDIILMVIKLVILMMIVLNFCHQDKSFIFNGLCYMVTE